MDNHAYPNLKDLLILFFLLLAFMIGTGLIFGLIVASCQIFAHITPSPLVQSLINLLGYTISILATILIAIRKSKKRQPDRFHLSFNSFPLWLIPVLIVTTLAMTIGTERLSTLIPMPGYFERLFESLFKTDIISIMMITVAAPLLEELLCRGIVLKGLLKNYPAQQAVIYSALFFALIHLNPWQAIPAFVTGLFLGWLYYKTKSVIPGIIVHATNNSAAVALMFVPKAEKGYQAWLGWQLYIIVCILALIVFVGSILLMQKKLTVIPENNLYKFLEQDPGT